MVVIQIATVGAALVLFYGASAIVRLLGGGANTTLIVQTIVASVMAAGLYPATIGLPLAVALVILPTALRVVATVWFMQINKKVLRGDFGEESKWAAEIVQNGDEEFVQASNELSQMQLKEAGIVADSREALRERVVEMADETNDSSES
jgi:hypothetical protein